MKRRQIFVRGLNAEGKWDAVDVMDLDDESFRAFTMEQFILTGIVVSIAEEFVESEPIVYKAKPGVCGGGT